MGQSILSQLWKKKEVRILINGLDASGKTTMLYRMKLGEVVTTIPTIGFNVETVQYKNIAMTVWDVGGRDKIRPLYRHYYPNTEALIFVIDCDDRDRLEEAVEELHKILGEEELAGIPVVVLANKQDLVNPLSMDKVRDAVGVTKFPNHNIAVFATSGAKGWGMDEALEWLSDQIARKSTKDAVVKPLENTVPTSVSKVMWSVSAALTRTLGSVKSLFSSS